MFRCSATALLLLAVLLPLAPAAAPPVAGKRHKPNRLARESSPYLLQHAHNPVDWYPWGTEAFAKAKKEGKLVFLSIGYSACHWCHVMEKESFSSPDVAKILNDHFVCIKVDREERPDVDQVYQTAVMVYFAAIKQGRAGGWPLSMFLDAQGRPIFGGTYWPKDDFEAVLRRAHDLNRKNPKGLAEQAEDMANRTKVALSGLMRGRALIDLDRKLVKDAVEEITGEFDKLHGGFGNPERNFRGTKFPMPSYLLLLQNEARRSKSKVLADIVEVTLDRMARGGIYDHLGGGFARYSTERSWTVPHFEKMLYDNAQLLEVYAAAYGNTKKPAHARVLRQTVDFVAREMTSPEGAFYSALDADSEDEEGRFYVWTARELARALTDRKDLALFRKAYGAEDGYNFEGKYHILRLAAPLADLAKEQETTEDKLEAKLAALRKRLFAVRAKRSRPFLDTKVLTAWNGQMIAGMARAGEALGDREAIARAKKAAEFILGAMRTREGRLLRSYAAVPGSKPKARLNGYLDDYAYLVHGLLALYDVTGEARWLDESKALTDTMVKWHGDDRGGFYYTSSDHEKLFTRTKDQYDGVQPSGNSAAASNLVRLWIKTGEAKYSTLAEKTFKSLSPTLKTGGSSLTALADALALWLEKKAEPDFTPEEGFTSLFNGKDLTGWYYRGSKEDLEGKTQTADERIKVEGGVIVMMAKDNKGKGGIKDLYTIRKFPRGFHLRLEFRASLKADSGVYVRGPQLQVRDFIRRNEHRHLKKFRNDDWNTLDIVVRNKVLTATVNGKHLSPQDNLALAYKDGKASATLNGKSVEPRNVQVRIANVAECTCNGEPLEVMTSIPDTGGIGLQAETGKFEFRRIRIKVQE
jgi:uncharacterized protein YyaL (SSP411 family)